MKNFLNSSFKKKTGETSTKQKLTLFYKNQMTSYYKNEEKQIRKIISDHVKPKEINTEIKLQIYYKSRKLKNIITKNNQNSSIVDSNVVYMYKCPKDGCHTTNKIRDRLQQHTYKGSIKDHALQHNKVLNLEHCINNTEIIAMNNNRQELIILEALLIKQKKPLINIQTDNFSTVLNIFK